MLRPICFLLLFCFHTPFSNLQADDSKSGQVAATVENRDPWAIRFDGLKTLNAQKLRRALWGDSHFRRATQSRLSDEQFSAVLKSRLNEGMNSSGFPQASISVTLDPRSQIWIAEINEGKEFRWGSLRIEPLPGQDVSYFTATLKRLENHHFSEQNKAKLRGWRARGRAITTAETEGTVRTLIASLAGMDGLHEADYTIRFENDPQRHLVSPIVTFTKPGFHALISEIEIEGLHENTLDEVCQFLKIKPGMRFNGQLRDRILDDLKGSGRFLTADVFTEIPFAEDHAVPLLIRVREYDLNPRLAQPQTPVETALIRLAGWANTWSHPQDQIEVRFSLNMKNLMQPSATEPEAESPPVNTVLGFNPVTFCGLHTTGTVEATLITAPQSGAILNLRAVNEQGGCVSDVTIVLTPSNATLIDWVRQQKWACTCSLPGASQFISLEGVSNPAVAERTRMLVGAGITSASKTPVSPVIQLNPTAFLHCLMEGAKPLSIQVENKTIRLTSKQFFLEMESESGRLKSARFSDASTDFDLKCGAGFLSKALESITERSHSFPNLYREDHGISSLALFLAPRIRASFEPNDSNLADVLDRVLRNSESIDGFTASFADLLGGGRFQIPQDDEAAVPAAALPSTLKWLESAGPPGSTLDRLLAISRADNTASTEIVEQFVTELATNSDHGPLDCWLTATLFPGVRPQAAAIGLTRLDAAHFLQDMQPFLDEKWSGGEVALALVGALQAMSEDQAELLARAVEDLPAPRSSNDQPIRPGRNIRPLLTIIRQQSEVPPRTVLENLLTLAWHSGLQKYTEAQLIHAAQTKDPSAIRNISRSFGASGSGRDGSTKAADEDTPPRQVPSFGRPLQSPDPSNLNNQDQQQLQEQLEKIRVE